MTRTWTDEQISAAIDGELSPSDAEAFARDVDVDPALAARLERLGSATRAYIAAVSEIDRQPMPEGVQRVLASPPVAKVIPFRASRIGVFVMEHRAIAAAVVCAIAVWGVSSMGRGGGQGGGFAPQPDGIILASSSLHRALETGASGERVPIAQDVSVTPRLTFLSSDAGYCRQFDVMASTAAASAIACRTGGRWRTQVVEFGRQLRGGDYQTASGAKSAILEAFIDLHIAGTPLGAVDEERLVAKGWRVGQ
ncbi:MAG: hypothetical protein Q8R02_24135 [Hyphomonadaceae bacterium]|nr:hypothetical protein [Hyphomonadaceae bacterium]